MYYNVFPRLYIFFVAAIFIIVSSLIYVLLIISKTKSERRFRGNGKKQENKKLTQWRKTKTNSEIIRYLLIGICPWLNESISTHEALLFKICFYVLKHVSFTLPLRRWTSPRCPSSVVLALNLLNIPPPTTTVTWSTVLPLSQEETAKPIGTISPCSMNHKLIFWQNMSEKGMSFFFLLFLWLFETH